MVVSLLLVSFFTSFISASEIVSYKFGQNFGQIFYDHSGSKNHGQNGQSTSTSTADTIPTSRGAYFSTASVCYIMLPPNDVNPTGIVLGSIFSIVMWFHPLDRFDYYLTMRILDTSNFFSVIRVDGGNYLKTQIKRSSYDSGELESSIHEIFKNGNKNIGIWVYFVIVNQGAQTKYYANNNEVLSIGQSSDYLETGTYKHYIGYTSSSLEGFVWSYYVYDEAVSVSDFYSASYSGSNCLVSSCPSSCTPAIKENGIEYCISVDKTSTCTSCSNGCIGSICLDCSCSSQSCTVTSGTMKCLCLEGTASSCSCTSTEYILKTEGFCQSCYGECSSCSETLKCSDCKDTNSKVHNTIGCTCKTEFYNTTALINSGTCLSCHSDCSSCIEALKCTSCKDSYSKVDTSVGCICIDGYYNITALSQQGACLSCYSTCKTCKEEKKCLTCDDVNAKPGDDFGCVCKDGFFNDTALENGGTCQRCHSNCKTCSKSLMCVTCNDVNAEAHLEVGCECKTGFYNTSSLDNDGSCLVCFSECKSCSSQYICNECIDSHSTPISSGGCLCEAGYYNDSQVLSEGMCQTCYADCQTCTNSFLCETCLYTNSVKSSTKGCDCITGYYKDFTGNCQSCHQDCISCSSFEICSECYDKNSIPSENQCECIPSFYNSSSTNKLECSPCPSNCSTCENPEKCTTCLFKNMNPINGLCKCQENFNFFNDTCFEPCPDFTYFKENSCKSCPDLCIKCDPSCIECVNNSGLNSSKYCECDFGFESFNNSCEEKFFEAFLEVKSFDIAVVSFSENLNSSLEMNNFNFTVGDRKDLSVKLLKMKENREFTFSVKFQDAVEKGTRIQVKITPGVIFSSLRSQLKEYLLNASLPSYSPSTVSATTQAVLSSTTAMAQTAVSSSIGASIMSNPSAAWALLNSIQILILLPLNSNNMTSTIRTFLTGFSGYNILPNVLEYVFDNKATSKPYLEAKRYGIETSVLFLNTGKSLSILVVTVLMYPLVLCLSKCKKGKITAKAIKMLGNYKYSFFLRFWTQTLLELMVFGLVQLRSSVEMPVQGYFNQFFATLFVVIIMKVAAVLTPPLLFVSSYVSLSEINNGSDEFNNQWGSLFAEFKNDRGFWSSQYYFLYFLRRVAFVLSQVYLNSILKLQGGLNIFFSILSVAFLLFYLPFKETSILISNAISEICIALVMIFTYCYLWELTEATSNLLENAIIFTVLSGMLLQFIISIYIFAKSMLVIYRKIEKARSLEFVKKAEKTFPEMVFEVNNVVK